ncbi:DoxX family protein [Halobacteriovorax sp. XZX-3]|uniref:DoxX family protein n=1 Tax=unclassified Halobacteriovorax TaxID=2639665 RepID=UPI003712DD78
MNRLNSDLGWLVLRVSTALIMLLAHGWGKLANFTTLLTKFPDPIGLGIPFSLTATVFAEVFCQVFIIVGFKTRWFAAISAFTMIIAAFVVHGADPFGAKELALMYAVVYIAIFFSNGGKYSVKA